MRRRTGEGKRGQARGKARFVKCACSRACPLSPLLFPRPYRYQLLTKAQLQEKGALKLFDNRNVSPELFFSPSAQTKSRFFPLLKVRSLDRNNRLDEHVKPLYLNQDGKRFENLTPTRAGN